MQHDELTESLRIFLKSQPDIRLAILFGSIARGTARTDSDVDIAVLQDHPLSVIEKTALIEKISILSGRPIDLIDLATVGEPLLGEVLQGKRLMGSDEHFARLLTQHLLDAADFLPLQQRILQERRDAWIK